MKRANGMGTIYKLSGNRRRPYIVRVTVGWDIDVDSEKSKIKLLTIGYAATQQEAVKMLNEYNEHPYSIEDAKITFADVYERWSKDKFPIISESNIKGYSASYKCCEALYDRPFRELKLIDLQGVIDSCNKNYPTLRKLRVLLNQMYDYAMRYEICNKDYSKFVNITKFKDKNPNKMDRTIFEKDEIERLWQQEKNKYVQIVLMLIYSGVRVSELLNLKRENVNLDEHCFNVVESKTENGIRLVPIHDKTYPFFKKWYEDENEYLLHTPDGKRFIYRNYYDSYWQPAMELVDCSHKPHDTRHTCLSMLTEKYVSPTLIKKIVGHSGAMTLTERVYTHVNVDELLKAINKI